MKKTAIKKSGPKSRPATASKPVTSRPATKTVTTSKRAETSTTTKAAIETARPVAVEPVPKKSVEPVPKKSDAVLTYGVIDEKEITNKLVDIAVEVKRLSNVWDFDSEAAAARYRNEVLAATMKDLAAKTSDVVRAKKKDYDDARAWAEKIMKPFRDCDDTLRAALNNYLLQLKAKHEEEIRASEREQVERELQAAKNREAERQRITAEVEAALESLPIDASQEMIDRITDRLKEFEQPVQVAPRVQVSKPETSGLMTQQDNWKAEVTNKMEVVRQVVSGVLPEELIEVRLPEANKLAALYKFTKKFEGLKFYNEPFTRSSGRR